MGNRYVKTIFFFLFLFLLNDIFAQQQNLLTVNKQVVVGKNIETNKDIIANEYLFKDNIYEYHIDSSSKQVNVLLRDVINDGKKYGDEGTMLVLGLHEPTIKWATGYNVKGSNLWLLDNEIVERKKNTTLVYDLKTGDEKYSCSTHLIYINKNKNIGIGYKYYQYDYYYNILQCINLTTGKKIWETDIKSFCPSGNISMLNDSTLLADVNGLHTMNINTGKGWSYECITKAKDTKGNALVATSTFLLLVY
jgi:hypothetical protein